MTQLGTTQLNVSRAVLGTMTFGSQVNADDAAAMVDTALERGINFIDTANVYNLGESERILGNVLKGRRDRVILATKAGIRVGDGPDDSGLSSRAIITQLEASLSRLQTDYVDVFYLHQPDANTPIVESLETVDRLIQAGKIRLLGTSNYAAWQVMQMLSIAQQHGWTAPTVAQPMYNLLARGIEQEFLPMCREVKMAVVAYNPLAGGLLTGKQQPAAPLTGTRFDTSAAYRDRYWHAANFQAIAELERVAQTQDTNLIGLALRWLLSQATVTGIILGASQLSQLTQNLNAIESGRLASEALEACDRVWATLKGPVPQYNR